MRTLFTTLALGAALAGCGSSATAQRDFSERDILAALHLRTTDNGITYHDPRGCTVNQVLNTPEEVDLYRGSGDSVVSDDDNEIGVKAVDASPSCQSRFQRELNRLTAD